MTKKLGVLIIHGMGRPAPNFADKMILSLTRRLGTRAASVEFESCHWSPVLQTHQDRIWERVQHAIREQDRNLSGPGRGHKTPLLGLAKVFDSTYRTDEFWHKDSLQNLKQWQELFWNDIPVPNGFAEDGSNGKFVSLKILGSRRGNIGAGRIRFTHGSFDNSSEHFKDVIEGIRGGSLLKPLTSLNY